MKSYHYFLIIIVFFSCKKTTLDLDKLVPITTNENYNTQNFGFGCLINETIFVARVYNGGWTGQKSFDIRFFNDSIKKVRIVAQLENKEDDYFDQKIIISFVNFKGVGIYELKDSTSYPSYVFPTFYDPTAGAFNTTQHHLDPNYENSIEITHIDEVEKIIAGRFNFTVLMGSQSYTITEGRFKKHY